MKLAYAEEIHSHLMYCFEELFFPCSSIFIAEINLLN